MIILEITNIELAVAKIICEYFSPLSDIGY
jgi:hypothetical protein